MHTGQKSVAEGIGVLALLMPEAETLLTRCFVSHPPCTALGGFFALPCRLRRVC